MRFAPPRLNAWIAPSYPFFKLANEELQGLKQSVSLIGKIGGIDSEDGE